MWVLSRRAAKRPSSLGTNGNLQHIDEVYEEAHLEKLVWVTVTRSNTWRSATRRASGRAIEAATNAADSHAYPASVLAQICGVRYSRLRSAVPRFSGTYLIS